MISYCLSFFHESKPQKLVIEEHLQKQVGKGKKGVIEKFETPNLSQDLFMLFAPWEILP